MPERIKITTAERDGATIITISGDLSLAAIEEFEVAINTLAGKRPKLAVFDMTAVSFVSSLAMGSLVSLHHSMKTTSGGRIVLAGLQPMIRRAFETAKLNQLIGLVDSVDEAIKRHGG